MSKPRTWSPRGTFAVLYIGLMVLVGVALLGVLFIGTDVAFRGEREVDIPYLITIRGDIDPPYWELHPYGILTTLVGIPLAVATMIVSVLTLIHNRKRP